VTRKPAEFAVMVNGELCFTVKKFAKVTNRSEQSVRGLIARGNRVRRLKIIRLADRPFVPYSELIEFPFTVSGRTESVYHYDENGKIVEEVSTLQTSAEITEERP
jgi:hypothetical protein